MRRIVALLLIAVLLTMLIPLSERTTTISLAQEDPFQGNEIIVNGSQLDQSIVPGAMIDGVASETMVMNSLNSPLALVADEPEDRCQDAPEILLYPEFPADGIRFETNDATEDQDDPPLTCMWGNPSRQEGYRTVWYKLIVPATGLVTLNTFSSTYDTVLGVFLGECENLEPVRCEDDSNGFSSSTTFPVSAGETYYIEVADWQPGIPDKELTLNFSAVLNPLETRWEPAIPKPTSPAISRHATVSQFDMLYIIGGQNFDADGNFRVSNNLLRFNTYTNQLEDHLAQIPGLGYSNSTAALVGNRIFVPSGFDGNNLGYDGRHWAYTIDPDRSGTGFWKPVASVPRVDGKNFAWAASAVPLSNDRYYLIGGTSSTELFDSQTVSNDEAFVYLANSDTWLQVASMQTARYAHTATWIPTNGLGACVAGGLGVQDGGQFVFHSSAECYHPTTGWRWVGDMNIPRIGAGSVTGPDGKWYVFGGLTAIDESTLVAVLQTEVYDPVRNTWTLLPPEYNLGGQDLQSARAFTSGNMVGNELYVTGGSIFFEGEKAVNLTEKLRIPSTTAYMPAVWGNLDDYLRPDDTFAEARGLVFGEPQKHNFNGQRDFYDVFTFYLKSATDVQIRLEVPDHNNFDLYLYDQNKLLWSSSTSFKVGADEFIPRKDQFLRLGGPQRYYVIVERVFPTERPNKGDHYKITSLRQ